MNQKDFSLIRTYIAENNGLFEYKLSVQGDPVKDKYSAHVYDFGLVNVSENGDIHLEMYKNNESIPAMDIEDSSTFIVPVKIN